MQPPSHKFSALTSVALLGLVSVAVAHGHDEGMEMDMGDPSPRPTISAAPNDAEPESYFQYGEHSGLVLTHIFLMTIAWVFMLPIGLCDFKLCAI